MIFPIVIPENDRFPTPIGLTCPDGFCPTLIKKNGTLAPLDPKKVRLHKLYMMLLDKSRLM